MLNSGYPHPPLKYFEIERSLHHVACIDENHVFSAFLTESIMALRGSTPPAPETSVSMLEWVSLVVRITRSSAHGGPRREEEAAHHGFQSFLFILNQIFRTESGSCRSCRRAAGDPSAGAATAPHRRVARSPPWPPDESLHVNEGERGLSECAVLGLPSALSAWSAFPWSAIITVS